MLPDWISNPGPLTYESGALPIALRGPACNIMICLLVICLLVGGDKTLVSGLSPVRAAKPWYTIAILYHHHQCRPSSV